MIYGKRQIQTSQKVRQCNGKNDWNGDIESVSGRNIGLVFERKTNMFYKIVRFPLPLRRRFAQLIVRIVGIVDIPPRNSCTGSERKNISVIKATISLNSDEMRHTYVIAVV